ncbi:uncharacterized protein N7500_003807 [Penicillium coprophilum]|uniref:uncharacterized protein n=1 Tax=Penicillium coprophilum TaxID=36646 RepID=UPI00238256DE|nr:uncharacterized protein N7500_003807 [Penicillium coprophilum]KAJ5171024.1 hypothetical protein N7500_003807 [Penicillium coprophilum]
MSAKVGFILEYAAVSSEEDSSLECPEDEGLTVQLLCNGDKLQLRATELNMHAQYSRLVLTELAFDFNLF